MTDPTAATGPDGDTGGEDAVWQPRCVFCGAEHYVLAVVAISLGKAGCARCGRVPPVYRTEGEYRAALSATRRQQATPQADDGSARP